MGFLDKFFLGKKTDPSRNDGVGDASSHGAPFKISTSLNPVRLKSKTQSSSELRISLQNITEKPLISSVVITIPKHIGFDGVGISKTKELRIGNIDTNETKMLSVNLNSNNQTPAGLYRVQITAYSHYRDYTHILNSVRKPLDLRIV